MNELKEAKRKLAEFDAEMARLREEIAAERMVSERRINTLQEQWVKLYDSEERRALRRAIEKLEPPTPAPHVHSEGLCSCGEPKGHPRGYYRG